MEKLDADTFHVLWAKSKPISETPNYWRRAISGVCNVLFSTILLSTISIIIAAMILLRHSPPRVQMLDLGNCGHTWQDAEQRGCVFDVMAGAWIRAECKEAALSDEYFADGNWTFYRDAEGLQVLPHAELLSGRVPLYYTEGSFDFKRCSYIWHKQVRQMGKPMMLLDSESRSWDSSLRCLQLFATADTSHIHDKTSSKTIVGYMGTGNPVTCYAGSWQGYSKPLAHAMPKLH